MPDDHIKTTTYWKSSWWLRILSVYIISHSGRERPVFVTVITSPITASHETRKNSVSVKVTETPVIQQEATPGLATQWAHLVSSTLCWDLEKVLKLKLIIKYYSCIMQCFQNRRIPSSGYSRCSSACTSQCRGLISQTNAQLPKGMSELWASVPTFYMRLND